MSMKTVGDPYVFNVQHWLNNNYGQYVQSGRFNLIEENGKTGWATIYALTRALQIQLGIAVTADNFGKGTIAAFEEKYPSGIHQQADDDETEDKIYGIIQGALLCKGYATGVSTPTLHFYNGTGNAIKSLKADAGINNSSSTVTLNVMKALLSMDYFYSYDTSERTQKIINMQRYLNHNYESYMGGLMPCDGVYGRGTNKALIYAIQAEEGMPISVANGNCGPSTKRCLPTLSATESSTGISYIGESYSIDNIDNFKLLANMALYFNGFGSGNLNSSMIEDDITAFQLSYSIPGTGKIDYTTWLSLLISCGDVNRSAMACDCATILTPAKAQTLYNNGYRKVGRYLCGNIQSGASKALSKEELQIAHDAGLAIFPIYQTSANRVSYFTIDNAINDANSAFEYASALDLPTETNIYFAVDCDPLDSEITNYIIPYFEKLNYVMSNNYNNKYFISIYGTRNTCTRVSNKGFAKYSFVSDMSTGFSGNLGFSLPNNWAFDQFATITVGSGDGQIEIDKDAASGNDLGLISDLYLKDVGKVYYSLLDMYNLALTYTNNNQSKSNQLVLQYIRKSTYGDTTIFGKKLDQIKWDIKWEVIAGTIDAGYCNLVDQKLYNLSFDFIDTTTSKNISHDFKHLAATLNALLYQIGTEDIRAMDEILDCYAGWGGDTISFATSIQNAVAAGEQDYQQWAKENICGEFDANFNLQDYIDDIDAYNLYYMITTNNYTLPEAFFAYYVIPSLETHIHDYEKRTTKFLEYLTPSHFNYMCTLINTSESPIQLLKEQITSAEQKYIDAAIEAIKYHVFKEQSEGK